MGKPSIQFNTPYGQVKAEFSTYRGNDRTAIILTGLEAEYAGEQIAVLTVNLPDSPLGEDEFFVKNWSENQEVALAALASGHFIDTGRRVRTGFVDAPVWRLK